MSDLIKITANIVIAMALMIMAFFFGAYFIEEFGQALGSVLIGLSAAIGWFWAQSSINKQR